jgi:hypothetical protein
MPNLNDLFKKLKFVQDVAIHGATGVGVKYFSSRDFYSALKFGVIHAVGVALYNIYSDSDSNELDQIASPMRLASTTIYTSGITYASGGSGPQSVNDGLLSLATTSVVQALTMQQNTLLDNPASNYYKELY